MRLITTRQSHVIQRCLIHWEKAACRPIFRRHIGDCCAVWETQIGKSRTVEFDEFSDDTVLAKHLYDSQRHIGCSYTRAQRAGQLESADFWQQHVNRLTKHHGLGFDSTDAPAENTEPVDHRRVAIGAN